MLGLGEATRTEGQALRARVVQMLASSRCHWRAREGGALFRDEANGSQGSRLEPHRGVSVHVQVICEARPKTVSEDGPLT